MAIITKTLYHIGPFDMVAAYDENAPEISSGFCPQFATVTLWKNNKKIVSLGKVFITKESDFKISSPIEQWKNMITYVVNHKRRRYS